MSWITPDANLSIASQCVLVGVNRTSLYRTPAPISQREVELMHLIDEEYTRHPFYGSRRMAVYLRHCGYKICRKRVQTIMRKMGLVGMAPGPNTSKPHPQNPAHPYLLRGLEITHPNQVWSSDITYIRMKEGFMYLTAVLDWYSRKVLSWGLSNTLDSHFVVDAIQTALGEYGVPEIFNSDQGVQYTDKKTISVLKANHIKISMDGRGRACDNIFVERLWRNVKYEDIYLKTYASVEGLLIGMSQYFAFYNNERWHQSLSYKTPGEVYESGRGGGAKIIDKWPRCGNKELDICNPLENGNELYNTETEQAGKPMTVPVRERESLGQDTAPNDSKKTGQRCSVAV